MAYLVLALAVCGLSAWAGEETLPAGIIPAPAEPGIQVTLQVDKSSYAPGELLSLTFTLSQPAWVYIYSVRPGGEVQLIVPNRFLPEPFFPAGEHRLPPPRGWRLRVTEPEGREYLQLIATDRPLSFYQAQAFAEHPFLSFTDPEEFARSLEELLVGSWGAAWTSFLVQKPWARLRVLSHPPGAEVWAGAELWGTTPLTVELPPGRIRLTLRLPGYRPETRSLTLAPWEERELFVPLQEEVAGEPALPGALALEGWAMGVSLGRGSIGVELWAGHLGLGWAVAAGEPPPSPLEPGPGEWVPWGPAWEICLLARLPLTESGGSLFTMGVSFQEWAWYPPWLPSGGLGPAVVVEPETRLRLRPTFGLGLAGWGERGGAYLLWHSQRGPVVGVQIAW